MSPSGRLLVGALAALLLVFASGCGDAPSRLPSAYDAVLHRGLGGEPGTLDPQKAGDTFSYEILRDLYEGLTTEAPDGRVVGGAAESWSVTPDGLRYTFRLRPGLKWSDGSPLVAADFVAALRRAVDPATASPSADLLRSLRGAADVLAGKSAPSALGVSAADERTVVVEVAAPTPFLPALLAHPVAFPVHQPTLAKLGNGFTQPGVMVSNGAYRLAAAAPGMPWRLERNPRFRDAGTVRIAAVEYHGVADENAELTRYRAGELDVTGGLPAQQVGWARRELPQEVQIAPQLATFFLGFDLTQRPFKDQPGLREALSLVLDRELLTDKVLAAGQVPAYGLVPPGMQDYTAAAVPWSGEPLAARVARARQLYAAAGYSAARPLKLKVLFNQNETIKTAMEAIAGMWKQLLGVECEFIVPEFRVFLAARGEPAGWDVVRLGWNADYNDASNFLDIFRTRNPQNNVGFADAAYDALLDRAAAEQDVAARAGLLQSAEARLLDSHAIVPVYFIVSRRMVKPWVLDARQNGMNHNYTRYWGLAPRAK